MGIIFPPLKSFSSGAPKSPRSTISPSLCVIYKIIASGALKNS